MSRERFGSYSWAADNNQANLEKHGWSFQSASIALDHGRPVPGNTRTDGRDEHIASLNGETIKVVSERRGGDTQIISAHKNRDLAKEYDAKAAEQGVTKNAEHNADFSGWRRLDKEQHRRASKAVNEVRQTQEAERQALDQRADLSPEHRAQLQGQQADQHKQQAQQDRQPRLEHDAKEREQLARQQGRQVERQEGRAQQSEQQPTSSREAKPEQSQAQPDGQPPRRFDPQARRERLTQEAEERGPPTHDHDHKRGR